MSRLILILFKRVVLLLVGLTLAFNLSAICGWIVPPPDQDQNQYQNVHSNSNDSAAKTRPIECSIARLALIGIMTTADASATSRRQILRQMYRNLNANIAPELRIDVRFVFGNPHSASRYATLASEQLLFPDETVSLNIPEARDDGKILEWFTFANSMQTTQSQKPNSSDCRRYQFIGKADDDAVIHIPRLSLLLGNLTQQLQHTKSLYVGRYCNYTAISPHMTGMLYFVSADLADWVARSSIPRSSYTGIEDVVFGHWMRKAEMLDQRHVALVDLGDKLIDLPESPAFSAGIVTNETVVVHWCKDLHRMSRCLSMLFNDGIINPTVARRLITMNSLTNRLDRFGVSLHPHDREVVFKTIEKLVSKKLENSEGVRDSDIDALLLKPVATLRLSAIGLSDRFCGEMDGILEQLSNYANRGGVPIKLGWRIVDRYILEHLVAVQANRFGYILSFNQKHLAVKRMLDVLKAGSSLETFFDTILIKTAHVKLP